jgi:hypothetical protein
MLTGVFVKMAEGKWEQKRKEQGSEDSKVAGAWTKARGPIRQEQARGAWRRNAT